MSKTFLHPYKKSDKKYCSKCKKDEDEVVHLGKWAKTPQGIQYYLCRPCNSKRLNDYYHNGGKENIMRANKKYKEKQK